MFITFHEQRKENEFREFVESIPGVIISDRNSYTIPNQEKYVRLIETRFNIDFETLTVGTKKLTMCHYPISALVDGRPVFITLLTIYLE